MAIELLAPAGSYESMTAAFMAGADAVYIGGTRFGARAFADNLDEEQMKRAIDYAHIHDRQLYLTVNTLLKDSELDSLYDYLNPFYKEGLDAVIVQDYGVLKYIREQFPDMDIHASTQMTVTGSAGASLLKEFGATRIVTAREMGIGEIQAIHETVDIEIESFVHGALCFCYSGQCLLSSMIGGRSGNRGRCAQPCRLPYELYENGKKVSSDNSKYLCSPKDMCTIDLIPSLIEAGIYSFKMEGRMKKPAYTAGITSIYRKYIDLYFEKGKNGCKVSDEDFAVLCDLYNRGGFSTGYYEKHNGKDMMSLKRPNHCGTPAAKIISVSGQIKCKALEPLHTKDILEIPCRKDAIDLTLSQYVPVNQTFSISMPKDGICRKNQILYRTRNNELLDQLEKDYLKEKFKIKINGILRLFKEKSATLILEYQNHVVTVDGDMVQGAQKRPMTEEEIARQIRKTGQTNVTFDNLKIQMDPDIFLPMQSLNELRRNGITRLEEFLITKKYRSEKEKIEIAEYHTDESTDPSVSVSVENKEQFYSVLDYPEIRRIYISSACFQDMNTFAHESEHMIRSCHENKKECFYITPWIDRAEKGRIIADQYDILLSYDGILVKSFETFSMLKERNYPKYIIADHNLYTWNQPARVFLQEHGFVSDTVPLELKYSEIRQRGCRNSEILLYGYTPLMISAQCFRKNTIGCDRKPSFFYLKDRKGIRFPVKNLCSQCSNIIYNSAPTELIDYISDLKTLQPLSFRLAFTVETTKETKAVLSAYLPAVKQNQNGSPVHDNFTRGHFKRGVD